jgi:hypothetical protein
MTNILAEKSLSPENLLHRRHIAGLYEQIVSSFKSVLAEQRSLAKKKAWEDEDQDAFMDAELFADHVCGYASYAATCVYTKLPFEAIQQLKCNSIFDMPPVEHLYVRHEADAPYMRRYIEAVDYLRLLIVEYINQFESNELY